MPLAGDFIQKLMGLSGANPEIDELFAQIAANRQGAETEAAQLGQQAEELRAAPAPDTDPLADLVTRAIGSVASSFKGTDDPTKRANAQIEAEKKQLLLKRASDLTRMDNLYEKAIERSQKLQDNETALKFAKEKAKGAEQMDLLLAMLKAEVDRESSIRDAKTRIRVAEINQGTGGGGIGGGGGAPFDIEAEIKPWVQALRRGDRSVLAQMPAKVGPYENFRGMVLDRADKEGVLVLPAKARATISALDGALVALKQLEGMNKLIVRGDGGFDMIKEGGKNAFAAFWKKGARGRNAAQYERFRKGLLATFVRMAGDVGTLNDQDIKRASELTPGLIMESSDSAADALLSLHTFITEKKRQTLETFTGKSDEDAEVIVQTERAGAKANKFDEAMRKLGIGQPSQP